MKYTHCPVCGKAIPLDPTSSHKKIYCSVSCRQKAYRKRKQAKVAPQPFREVRLCANCGKKYTATHKLQRYCSQRCKNHFFYEQRGLKKIDRLNEREVYAEYVAAR